MQRVFTQVLRISFSADGANRGDSLGFLASVAGEHIEQQRRVRAADIMPRLATSCSVDPKNNKNWIFNSRQGLAQ